MESAFLMPAHVSITQLNGPQPMMPPDFGIPMSTIFNDLLNQMAEMEALSAKEVSRFPMNPCAQDMEKFHCSTASCLRSKKDDGAQLAAACVSLIAPSKPQPSPDPNKKMPAPQEGIQVMFSTDPPSGLLAMLKSLSPILSSSLLRPSSEDSYSYGSYGNSYGSYGNSYGSYGNSYGSYSYAADSYADYDYDNDGAAPALVTIPSHPCAEEINMCLRASSDRSKDYVEACLLDSFDQLNARCKCFLKQVVGENKIMERAPHMMAEVPSVRAFPLMDEEEPSHPPRKMMCHLIFLMALFTLSFIFALRLMLCIKSKKQVTVTTVDRLEPLFSKDIKAGSNLLHTRDVTVA